MIGSLRGKLLRIDGSTALIEAGGVGYGVEMPGSSLNTLSPKLGSEIFVYVHHSVREDAQMLYGFTDMDARSLFRILIKVNGIGPKSALAALSTFSVASFVETVSEGRAKELQMIPGVGKKTAERMIVELKDAVSSFSVAGVEIKVQSPSADAVFFDEAVDALVALGYKEGEAVKYCKVALAEAHDAETLIKAALLLISKNKGR